MNYKSYKDLSLTINKNVFRIPRDVNLIVGVPRSGMLPATMIGQVLNKPVVALDSYIEGKMYEIGLYRRSQVLAKDISEIKKVLIIDDSINSGNSMNKVKERIRNSDRHNIETIYCAVYYVLGSLGKVDLGLEECPWPRIFQWNILNSWVLAHSCVDLDGVVCIDPTEEQNDDGNRYNNFLLNAKPLFLTEFPISCFVTSRLEKYRDLTERWLKKHNLCYNELIMLDLPTKEDRLKQNIHAKFKAEVYRNRNEELFIESNLPQAIQISKLTSKLVFCTENMEMIVPEENKGNLPRNLNTFLGKNNVASLFSKIQTQGNEKFSTRIMKNFVKTCDLFVDVGANAGYYSLLVADVSKTIKIIAVEPLAENYEVLNKNLIHDNISIERVKCINAAVSSSSGKVKFYTSDTSDNGSVILHSGFATSKQLEVTSVSLDDLLKNEQGKSLFIKIGTEGNELEVLKGLTGSFDKYQDISLLIEMNPNMLKLAGTSCKEVVEYLTLKGFNVYGIDDKENKYYPLEDDGNLYRLQTENCFFNALCIKKEKSLSVAFFSHSSILAGAERSLVDLVEDLCNDSVLCSVLLPSDGPLKDVLLDKGAAVFVLPEYAHWWVGDNSSFNDEAKKLQLTQSVETTITGAMLDMRQLRPDVIYTQTIVSPWGALCAEILSIPHVLSVCEYGGPNHYLKFYFGFQESIKALYDSSEAIFSITKSVKDEVFKSISGEKDKIEVVYRSVRLMPDSDFVVTPQNYDYKDKTETKIAIFGTIRKEKRQEDIVRAGIELMKSGRKVKIYIFGYSDPHYLAVIKDLINSSKYKNNFIIEDFVNDPIEHMKKMDIVVSCCGNEALGRTLFEAILLDKPIVYSDSGGPKEVFVDKEHGLAYKCANEHSLAENLLFLMDNPEKTRKRVKIAKEYVLKKFNRENYSGKIESRLRRIKGLKIKPQHSMQELLSVNAMIFNFRHQFCPVLYYSEREYVFEEQRKVPSDSVPVGPFNVEFELPDNGYRYLRFDPHEGKFAEVRIYDVTVETSLGKRYSIDKQDLEGNGKKINSFTWEFDHSDPSITIRLSETVKKIRIIGDMIFIENDRLQNKITSLSQAMTERIAQISWLNQIVGERNSQIIKINKTVTEREKQILKLNNIVGERNAQIARLNQEAKFRRKRVPCRGFNAKWYLDQNPDVAASGMDPYEHYMQFGKSEGRKFSPDPFFIRFLVEANSWWVVFLEKKRVDGIRNTAIKVWCMYKREGWIGVRNKVDFLKVKAARPGGILSVFKRNDYAEWIRRYDTLTDKKRVELCMLAETLPVKPLISVVMPVYNIKPEWLIQAIESVRKQIYPRWELCIADDASTDETIRSILKRYAKEDSRIKIIFLENNGGISAASNSALGLAAGEWVALLDHDDLLAEQALLWIADTINRYPQARLIYSDEDKINEIGKRFDPYFKCDWNKDLFYSNNFISHLSVYQVNLLRDLNGFRLGFEGSQDYDLVLRYIENIKPGQIYHIPRILYHWRAHAKSTAQVANVKSYAYQAGKKALDEHFRRKGEDAVAELLDYGRYRIRYTLPDTLPLVSLIILTRDRVKLLQKCIDSILKKTTYPNYEILIVDNGSNELVTFQYFKDLRSESRVRVVSDNRPFNYSALNNAAVKLAQGEVIGLLNNDLEVISPEWLSEMVSHALQPEVGAVGARLWYPDKTLQHGGVILGICGIAGHAHKYLLNDQHGYFGRASLIQGFSAVTAACLLIRKSVYEEVEGLNEVDLKVAFNDIDFCLRVRQVGYRNIWTPYAELYHHESATRGFDDIPEKQVRFAKEIQYMKQRWGELLLNDPAYSPNLTLDHQDFSLAWPPRFEYFLRD